MNWSSIAKSMLLSVFIVSVTVGAFTCSAVQAYVIADDEFGGECILIGTWNDDNKTCTLASNVHTAGFNGLRIESSNITVDGNNYTVQGDNTPNTAGVFISSRSNITVKNLSVSNYPQHIELRNSADHNTINNVTVGTIYLHSSSNIVISNSDSQYITLFESDSNTITDNNIGQISILMSTSCTMLRNSITSALDVDGSYWESSHWDHNITISNTMGGRPIYYIKNASDLVFDNSTPMGTFFCINCNSVTVDNLDLHETGSIYLYGSTNCTINGNSSGIELMNCNNSHLKNNTNFIRTEWSNTNTIEHNTIKTTSTGNPILLRQSDNNTIQYNRLSGNTRKGLEIIYSENNAIKGNTILGQIKDYGIYLNGSSNNTISHNNITATATSAIGILYDSDSNVVAENSASNCQRGVSIYSSDDNTIRNNTLSNNDHGIYLHGYMNKVYNNNFINNTIQAYSVDHAVQFNLDVPIGGNYWSDWDTPAEGCQDLNRDGFCDSAYGFDSDTWDNLPWTKKDGWVVQFPWPIFLPAITGGSTQ